MRNPRASRLVNYHVFPATIMLVILIVISPAMSLTVAGDETALGPGAVQIIRRDASVGSTIRWDWSASSAVVFSVSRVGNAQSILYATESVHDATSLTVSIDDTYLLLWTNVGGQSVTLAYSVGVEAGSGPILVILLVALLVIGTLILLFMLITRQDRARRHKRPRPPGFHDAQFNRLECSIAACPCFESSSPEDSRFSAACSGKPDRGTAL